MPDENRASEGFIPVKIGTRIVAPNIAKRCCRIGGPFAPRGGDFMDIVDTRVDS